MMLSFRPLGGLEGESADAARLHAALFPRSPLSRLGEGFLRGFYYRVLPSSGASVLLASVDGQPAGLIAVAPSAAAVRRVLRERAPAAFGSLALSLLAAPARLGAALRLLRLRGPAADGGEILSFGVLARHRQGPARLSQRLYAWGLERLGEGGARTARAVVDRDNLEARLFYAARGWRVEGEGDPAWPVATVVLSTLLPGGLETVPLNGRQLEAVAPTPVAADEPR